MLIKQTILKGCSMALLCAGMTFPALSQAETLRLGGNFAADHSSSRAMEIFKAELEKADVDVDAALFPAMQLGGAQENVDQVRSGAIFGTWIGIAYVSRIVPELEAVSLPFAFDSREQAFKLIDGPVGDTFNELLAKKGFTALGYMELGFRNITNNERPIESADDLDGLKIRLQPNETHLATFRALGANPVSMDVKELYGALQQGVLDGQENPYSIIETKRFNEVQKYLSDSKHFYDFIVVLANKDNFDSLSAEKQAAVKSALAKAVSWQREQAAAEDKQARQALIDAGMVFTPISDETRDELRARTSGIKDTLREKLGTEIIDQVEAELAK
ncbi:TRAP transporter substrate-binding protein [Marinobacterium lutimaris]|uniref:Tripartite ATP-independent transporter solute receptor, DctP family n=1 Tax=Marinobacterium lutimaris TaxID=568106 RepID=A0A1H6DN89_9GAMM|nr:TRAP transporter substrate-binding protein [Marinobacterium lutimaris]SEG86166.1 tripartite ATP-independent transporter solute receptor, DctP family [Marinobacterium lutimaris]